MFDWNSYIELAEELWKKGSIAGFSIECRLRNCISRTYYGVFGETRRFCTAIGIFSASGSAQDHEDLVNACLGHSDYDVKELGQHLRWLRGRRNSCDYVDDLKDDRLVKGNIQDVSNKALERAIEVRKLLGTLQNRYSNRS